MHSWLHLMALPAALILTAGARADVGDPQVRTDHPWYPGELACSTFERLQKTQAEVYERVTGKRPITDQDKALASWLWRNAHYAHGEEGAEDLWGQGFTGGPDLRGREYWTGLFAHGFGLCGTTHSQWTAEMQALLGHNRGRGVGVTGHNSFEVFLTGGKYGSGKWALLDHDISTVIFDEKGESLLSLSEVHRDHLRLTDRSYLPDRQQGWLVCSLHPGDGASYSTYATAEYLSGYAGAPPMVHLRPGETLRRYHQPGLEDGKTFVFWGRNYNTLGIPGPERSLTWVNQPEQMHGSREGTGYKPGQARYGNAVYTYRPNFRDGSYREGTNDEYPGTVTFEFYTPYIIGAMPPNNDPWGIYESGCKNGLVLGGKANCNVSVSADQGQTWHDCGPLMDGLDLTDHVKGYRQYFLRLHATAAELADSGLTMITVCQVNAAILPRLKDDETRVYFSSSDRAVMSAGPTLPQAQAHLATNQQFGTPEVTMKLRAPRGRPPLAVNAAAHFQSGNPPDPDVKYSIDLSTDFGKNWRPIVSDWSITRRGDEPADFWSQSFCWGSSELGPMSEGVRVRFRNSAGRKIARAEAHLIYQTTNTDDTKVTFAWSDDRGDHKASQIFRSPRRQEPGESDLPWVIPTGKGVRTNWVEFEPLLRR